MKQLLLTASLVMILQSLANAQDYQKAFYMGHSLSDQIAEMLLSMTAEHVEVDFDAVYQTIPGSPLRWNWENGATYSPNPPLYYGYNHPSGGLPNGTFTTLVLTESVPRYPSIIGETYEYASRFYEYAKSYNPNTKIMIYEVWHCINSGTPTSCSYDIDANPWRQRLDDDLPMWESVVDSLNIVFNPAIPVCLIPGGQGLAKLHDEIELGTVPGLTSINDIFTDDIHLSDIGKYFIACIHYTSLFGKSPEGLPYELENIWGTPFEAPSASLALRLQEIAYETVNTYRNRCNNDVTNISESSKLNISFYPNPSNGALNIVAEKPVELIEIWS